MVKRIVLAEALFFGIIAGVMVFLWLTSIMDNAPHYAGYLFGLMFGSIFTAVIALIAYETISDTKTITFEEGDCLVADEKLIPIEGTFWLKDPKIAEKKVIEAREFEAGTYSVSLSPITDNPKVRNISYNIVTTVYDRQEFYDRFLKNPDSESPWELIMKNCYEFNEQYSSKLGKFYNPVEKSQQEHFSQMITSYLGPFLIDTGISIEKTEFWINDNKGRVYYYHS